MSWTDLNAQLQALLPGFSAPAPSTEPLVGAVIGFATQAHDLTLGATAPTPTERAALATCARGGEGTCRRDSHVCCAALRAS